jgi:hypothetical protein
LSCTAEPAGVGALGRQFGGDPLDAGDGLEQVVGLLGAERRDAGAAVGLEVHESFGGEQLQRLAQRRAGHPEGGAKLGFADRLARRQVAAHDHRAQALGRARVQRRAVHTRRAAPERRGAPICGQPRAAARTLQRCRRWFLRPRRFPFASSVGHVWLHVLRVPVLILINALNDFCIQDAKNNCSGALVRG